MLPDGYSIRDLEVRDAPALAAAYARNRAHLEPWEPAREESFFTLGGQTHAVQAQLELVRDGLLVAWVLAYDGKIVGRVNLNNVVRGVLQGASVGYWVDAEHLGRGLATEAVEHACKQARARRLHRLEAGTMLHNTASQRVLERAGFEFYGVAEKFLYLAGGWQDHRLYQRILHDHPL